MDGSRRQSDGGLPSAALGETRGPEVMLLKARVVAGLRWEQ